MRLARTTSSNHLEDEAALWLEDRGHPSGYSTERNTFSLYQGGTICGKSVGHRTDIQIRSQFSIQFGIFQNDQKSSNSKYAFSRILKNGQVFMPYSASNKI